MLLYGAHHGAQMRLQLMFPHVQAQHPDGSQGVVQAVCKGGGGGGEGRGNTTHKSQGGR